MSIFGDIDKGPRSLAKDYVKTKGAEDREEIRERIRAKSGAPGVATWDEMEEDWLAGGSVSNDDLIEATVGMMPNTECRPPTPELPDDLAPAE